MKSYFITGTDTDCGKTYVTCQLINYYQNAVAIKPVASGCHKIGMDLVSSDAQELVKNNELDLDLINPWRFEQPVSPHIAAKKEGKTIQLSQLVDYCTQFEMPEKDLLFIEGAGGLMVPLNNEHTWLDFLKASQIPVIITVGMKLGCINHALLTMETLKAHQIFCAGWIANCIDPQMLAFEENMNTLVCMMDAQCLALVPYNGVIQVEVRL